VARYCSLYLPQFLKDLPEYKNGDLKLALEKAFIDFDEKLILPNVVEELKLLTGEEYARTDEEDEEDENEASILRQEANIPIEDLLARYSKDGSETSAQGEASGEVNMSSSTKEDIKTPLPPHIRLLTKGKNSKPLSPYLRAKSNNSEAEELKSEKKPCSSASSSSEISKSCEPCSSSSQNVPNGEVSHSSLNKINQESDSVSSSVNESLDDKSDVCKVSSTKGLDLKESDKCEISDSSSNKYKQANGERTNQENETDVSTSSEAALDLHNKVTETLSSTVAASTSGDEPKFSSKGKGKAKKKKVIEPIKCNEIDDEDAKPVYKAFLQDFDADSDDLGESDDDDTDDFKVSKTNSDSDEDINDDDNDDEEEDDSSEAEDDDEDEDEEDEEEDEDGATYFLKTSASSCEEPGKDSGCTAVLAALHGNQLYVANAGDSRCVLSRRGKAIDMSIDHKPEDDVERERIEKAGGKVTGDGRVNGGLNLSRAFGDHAYKTNPEFNLKEQMITAFPDIKKATIKPGRDEFMVLACDGIW